MDEEVDFQNSSMEPVQQLGSMLWHQAEQLLRSWFDTSP
jgi:hypothetical protein